MTFTRASWLRLFATLNVIIAMIGPYHWEKYKTNNNLKKNIVEIQVKNANLRPYFGMRGSSIYGIYIEADNGEAYIASMSPSDVMKMFTSKKLRRNTNFSIPASDLKVFIINDAIFQVALKEVRINQIRYESGDKTFTSWIQRIDPYENYKNGGSNHDIILVWLMSGILLVVVSPFLPWFNK